MRQNAGAATALQQTRRKAIKIQRLTCTEHPYISGLRVAGVKDIARQFCRGPFESNARVICLPQVKCKLACQDHF